MNTRIEMDSAEAEALMGYITGLSTTVASRGYINSVLDYSTSMLDYEFGLAADLVAKEKPERWNHVYEWGGAWGDVSTIGDPNQRLFKILVAGTGNKRSVSFTFLPSHVPSPSHPDLLEGSNPVHEGVHVFTWKAPVMEYGTSVVIRPKLSKILVFRDDNTGKIVKTTKSITAVPGKGAPGSGGTIGVFSDFFTTWWNAGGASTAFETTVRPQLEKDLGDEGLMGQAVSKYRRRKQVNITATSNIAFDAAREEAKKNYKKKSGRYLQLARERKRLYGD